VAAPNTPPTPLRAAKSDSKLEQQVGAKQQKVEKPSKSSKSAHVGSVWTQANAKSNLESQCCQKQSLRRQDLGVLRFMPTT